MPNIAKEEFDAEKEDKLIAPLLKLLTVIKNFIVFGTKESG